MTKSLLKTSLSVVVAALCAATLHAAEPGERPRLDVPYVPTNQLTVEAMLRIANVGPEDYVIDLGSGDGRILITAAKQRGARGFGVDIDPQRVSEAIENARAAGVSDRVRFYRAARPAAAGQRRAAPAPPGGIEARHACRLA